MKTITYNISIDVPHHETYEAFTSLGGMRSWWTNAISGNPEKGGELRLEFGMNRHVTFSVSAIKKNSLFALTGIESNFPQGEEWIGTTTTFKVGTNAKHHTSFSFTHEGWKDDAKFYTAANKQWNERIQSLKKLCENGKGDPEIITLARK
jgi:uncharacterized protein YndB with AHSA1/START domain